MPVFPRPMVWASKAWTAPTRRAMERGRMRKLPWSDTVLTVIVARSYWVLSATLVARKWHDIYSNVPYQAKYLLDRGKPQQR